jgi:hypothetical protein
MGAPTRSITAMSYLDDLSASLEARLATLDEEIAALESAREALAGDPALTNGARRPAGRPPRPTAESPQQRQPSARAGRTGSRRQPSAGAARTGSRRPALSQAELRSQVERLLQDAPEGLSAVTLAKRVNAGYGQVLALLRELESDGQIRRAGARRTSLWRLVSEEELIAERAAELERLAGA